MTANTTIIAGGETRGGGTRESQQIRPQMEPRISLEIPTVSVAPEPGELRQETPGEEASDGGSMNAASASSLRGGDVAVPGGVAAAGSNDNTGMKMKSDCEDDGDTDTLKKPGGDDEDDGIVKYEEELDPRIQACCIHKQNEFTQANTTRVNFKYNMTYLVHELSLIKMINGVVYTNSVCNITCWEMFVQSGSTHYYKYNQNCESE